MKRIEKTKSKGKNEKYFVILSILLTILSIQSCFGQSCSVSGSWLIKKGRLLENYIGEAPHSANRLTFHKDTIELASGFFYNTLGLDDDYPNGRFPFVYYGNKEKYKIENGLLYVFSKPYNCWSSYEIHCQGANKVSLIGKVDTLLLVRLQEKRIKHDYQIKQIKAHVHKGTLDIFNVGYKVSFSQDDLMIYEQQDSATENFTLRDFKLLEGTFENICKAFNYVDFSRLKAIYPATESDYQTVEIEIQFVDGKNTSLEIQDMAEDTAPDELRLALVPILYLHQSFVYPELKAKRFSDK